MKDINIVDIDLKKHGEKWYEREELFLPGEEINSFKGIEKAAAHLKKLNLSWNKLSEFPSEIIELYNLENLSLDNNLIKKIPPKINNLVKLIYLDLSNNAITKIPVKIWKLENLNYLYLSNNLITDFSVIDGMIIEYLKK